jgi:hypothetical protein
MKPGDLRTKAGNPERVEYILLFSPNSTLSGLLKPLANYYSYSIPSGF